MSDLEKRTFEPNGYDETPSTSAVVQQLLSELLRPFGLGLVHYGNYTAWETRSAKVPLLGLLKPLRTSPSGYSSRRKCENRPHASVSKHIPSHR